MHDSPAFVKLFFILFTPFGFFSLVYHSAAVVDSAPLCVGGLPMPSVKLLPYFIDSMMQNKAALAVSSRKVNAKAQRKSHKSGFTTGEHNYIAAHIRQLFKHAVHVGDYADKEASPDIVSIKRFVCPITIKNNKAFAYMTVKELKEHGHKIYTLELDSIEKLGGNLDEHFKEMLNPTPSGDIITRLENLGKTYFDNGSKGKVAKLNATR